MKKLRKNEKKGRNWYKRRKYVKKKEREVKGGEKESN